MISNLPKDYIEVFGAVKGESKLAVLIDFGDVAKWVPKSLMEDWPDVGDSGDVILKEWFAVKEEIV